jgi:hypothetical protein
MSYSDRNYRHRNPRGKEENQGKTPFFNAPKNAVNRKKKETIQRLATSKEDEKLSTNDARMEKDKEDPLKPVQKKDAPKKGKKEEEKPVQKKDAPKKGKKEEEKPVQKKGKKKEEEKPVQKKAKKKEEEKPVQKKEDKHTTSARVAESIKQQLGKGNHLPPRLLAEMNKSLGADLSRVCIHTDVAAAKLCRELHALAFTHGQDIFFDEGRYNPESPEGKKLLVHELTHVVQQSNTDN